MKENKNLILVKKVGKSVLYKWKGKKPNLELVEKIYSMYRTYQVNNAQKNPPSKKTTPTEEENSKAVKKFNVTLLSSFLNLKRKYDEAEIEINKLKNENARLNHEIEYIQTDEIAFLKNEVKNAERELTKAINLTSQQALAMSNMSMKLSENKQPVVIEKPVIVEKKHIIEKPAKLEQHTVKFLWGLITFNLNNGAKSIKNNKSLHSINDWKSPNEMLPKDNQEICFKTKKSKVIRYGLYIVKEDMFFIGFENESEEFYFSKDILCWMPINGQKK